MRRLAIAAAAVGVGAYALARYGRAQTRAELERGGFGRLESTEAAASLTFKDAAIAGARALSGKSAVPQLVIDASGGA